MNYRLTLAVLECTSDVEISEDRFLLLQQSRRVLTEALAMEEKYAIVLTNYLSLEREILNQSAADLVQSVTEYYDVYEVLHALNVRLVNLLTAARMYVDQLPRHVRACMPMNVDAFEHVKHLLSIEYDAHFEYRFMEALRNYAQHNGMPIHKFTSGGKWSGARREKDSYLVYGLALISLKQELARDGTFKKKVLDECNEEVDVLIAIRKYVSSISTVHVKCRDYVKKVVEDARSEFESAHTEFMKHAPNESKSSIGLEAQKFLGNSVESRIPLLLNWDDVRIKLQKKNRSPANLARSYVSGQSIFKAKAN